MGEVEQRYRAIFETSPRAIIESDEEGVITAWNAAALALFGGAGSGRPLEELMEGAAEQSLVGALGADSGPLVHRSPFTRPDGSQLTIEWDHRRISGNGLVSLARDLTSAARDQRLATLGVLAGGAMHDLNNVLAAIVVHSSCIRMESEPESDLHDLASDIDVAAARASDTVRQILTLSRGQFNDGQILSVRDVVARAEAVARALLRSGFNLERRSELLGTLRIDPARLTQVMVQLAISTPDATLVVESKEVDLDGQFCEKYDLGPAGTYVVVAVSVGGQVGQASHERHVRDLVAGSGGRVVAEGEDSGGVTYRMYFPAVPCSRSSKEAAAVEVAQPPVAARETVLVVDDEDPIRHIFRRLLGSLGYTVLEAKDGPSALQVAANHDGPIDLVLADVVMPHLPGPEVVRSIRVMRPGIRSLYMSGYSVPELAIHGLDGTENFMTKPFDAPALKAAVRQALDAEIAPPPVNPPAGQHAAPTNRADTLPYVIGGFLHDMKNLDTALTGNLMLMASGDPEAPTPEQTLLVSKTLGSMTRALQQVVQPYYLTESAQAGTTLIPALVGEVRTSLTSEFPSAKLSFRGIRQLPTLAVPVGLMRFVLSELARNGLKASLRAQENGGTPEVTVQFRYDGAHRQLRLVVSDRGDGFEERILRGMHDGGGTLEKGRGLHLVSLLVARLDGTLIAINRPGGGAMVKALLEVSSA